MQPIPDERKNFDPGMNTFALCFARAISPIVAVLAGWIIHVSSRTIPNEIADILRGDASFFDYHVDGCDSAWNHASLQTAWRHASPQTVAVIKDASTRAAALCQGLAVASRGD